MSKERDLIKLTINNLDELDSFSSTLAKIFFSEEKCLIFLNGPLGAGKTTLSQKLGKHLGVKDIITSPTFNIFKRYSFKSGYLNHFDLYRIESDVYDQGFEEYWYSNEITIIEWSSFLPEEFKNIYDLKIDIEICDDYRVLKINGNQNLINKIKEKCNEFIYWYNIKLSYFFSVW